MSVRIVQFFAIVVVALAVVPSGVHLAALPNKIGMPQNHYFVVQSAYRGWAWLGLLWLAALILSATSQSWSGRRPSRFGQPPELPLAFRQCSRFSLSRPSQRTRQRTTGQRCRRTGQFFASTGNTLMRPAPSWPCV